LALAVVGVRSEEVAQKIAFHLDRFVAFSIEGYGHDRISTCLRSDVLAWQRALVDQGLAPATVNNHLASLSAFTTWVAAQAPGVFAGGDPAKGIREAGLPPLEPRALTPAQLCSLKNLCDRLERFHRLKGQRWSKDAAAARAGSRARASLARPRHRLRLPLDGAAEVFGDRDFRYDADADAYRCPGDKVLRFLYYPVPEREKKQLVDAYLLTKPEVMIR
jgi:hypothetical protein